MQKPQYLLLNPPLRYAVLQTAKIQAVETYDRRLASEAFLSQTDRQSASMYASQQIQSLWQPLRTDMNITVLRTTIMAVYHGIRRNSSVVIVTRLRPGKIEHPGSIPGKGTRCSLLQSVKTGSGVQPPYTTQSVKEGLSPEVRWP